MNFLTNENYDGYCGTSYAAKLLSMSVGTVQSLVEKNELRAWKTQGGHRRISLQSIQDYQRRHKLMPASMMRAEERLRVMVVEDDDVTRLWLQTTFDQWQMPLDVVMYSSAMEALLDMFTLYPHVVITDLRMPHVDGFELLRTLRQHAMYQKLSAVLAITAMTPDEVQAKGGLPDGVKLVYKPIDLEWLKGFFDALLSVRQLGERMGAPMMAKA